MAPLHDRSAGFLATSHCINLDLIQPKPVIRVELPSLVASRSVHLSHLKPNTNRERNRRTMCRQRDIFAVCLPDRRSAGEDDLVGRFSFLEHTTLSEGLQEMTYKGLLTHTFGGFFTYDRQVKSICLFSLCPAHWPRRLGQSTLNRKGTHVMHSAK